MTRQLVIVARDRRDFYDSLCRTFGGDEMTAVLLDRRTGERRQRHDRSPGERRRGEQRRLTHVGQELRAKGWALVTLPAQRRRRRSSSLAVEVPFNDLSAEEPLD
jgi:hypothetical protein